MEKSSTIENNDICNRKVVKDSGDCIKRGKTHKEIMLAPQANTKITRERKKQINKTIEKLKHEKRKRH